MFYIRIISISLSLLLLSACGGGWVKVNEQGRLYQNSYFAFKAPTGWMLQDDGESIQLSKDGPDLQRIGVIYSTSKEAFPKLKKEASVDMLPSELAELTIAEIRASQDNGMPGMEVVSNQPVTIDGHQGFSVHIRYKLESGLRYETKVNGFVTQQGLYALYYRAPTLHYFNRDQEAYQSLVETFSIKRSS